MSIDNKTALIVGAGIAGSSLAFQLAKRDYQVTLLDDNNHDEIEIFFNKAVEVSPHFMLNNTSYNALMTKASKFSYQLIKDFNFSKNTYKKKLLKKNIVLMIKLVSILNMVVGFHQKSSAQLSLNIRI